jgi:nucleoside-diphosphate-sugar epimerase
MADLVLLTGISGFLGGHVGLELLNRGYRVRGSVRDFQRAERVRATLAKAGGDISRLEFVVLDLNSDQGWDAAMDGARFLQHTASPFVTSMPRDKMDLIRPAVGGTKRALNATLKSSVERVVLTSSMAATSYGHPADRTTPFSGADWTNLADGRAVNAYIESKTLAEKEAWLIMDGAGRHNDLAVINPNAILGPLLDEDPGTSASLIKRLMDGSVPAAARIYFSVVDVRDVAVAHVTAMTAPWAGGKRFAMGEKTLSLLDFANVIRRAMPEFDRRLPRMVVPDWVVRLFSFVDKDMRGNIGELNVLRRTDASEVTKLLGRPLISSEDATIATAKSLVAEGLVKAP